MKPTPNTPDSHHHPIQKALQELLVARSKRVAELEQLDRAIAQLTALVGGRMAGLPVPRKGGMPVKSRVPSHSGVYADEVAILLAKARKRPSELRSALRSQGIAISPKEMKKLLASDARFARVGMGWWELTHGDAVKSAGPGTSA